MDRIPKTFAPLLLIIALMPYMAYAQPEAVATPQAMSQEEAFQLLKDLNDKSQLFPESMFGAGGEYLALAPDNCFGLHAAGGWKLAGESAGKDSYGISFQYADDPSPTLQIGFLYSNAPFLLSDKALPAGAYAVLANAETFQLTGNAGTFHWDGNQRREVPDTLTEQFILSNSLDPAWFEKGAAQYPRFSLAQDGQNVFIAIGENRLTIRKQ